MAYWKNDRQKSPFCHVDGPCQSSPTLLRRQHFDEIQVEKWGHKFFTRYLFLDFIDSYVSNSFSILSWVCLGCKAWCEHQRSTKVNIDQMERVMMSYLILGKYALILDKQWTQNGQSPRVRSTQSLTSSYFGRHLILGHGQNN